MIVEVVEVVVVALGASLAPLAAAGYMLTGAGALGASIVAAQGCTSAPSTHPAMMVVVDEAGRRLVRISLLGGFIVSVDGATVDEAWRLRKA